MSDRQGAFRSATPAPDEIVWQRYGLAEIWQMVRDEDGVATYQQIGSWQFMAELCDDQAQHLQTALDQLMVSWPPTPGSASAELKALLDGMIGSMRESAAVAKATIHPLIDITTRLAQAKDQVSELQQQHQRYLAAERTPAGGRAGQPSPPRPPDRWREMLDQKARAIMASTDIAIGKNVDLFQRPSTFAFLPDRDEPGPIEVGDPFGHSRPPTISFPVFDPPPTAAHSLSMAPGLPAVGTGVDWAGQDPDPGPILDGAVGVPDGPSGLGQVPNSFVSTPSGQILAPGGVIGAPSVPLSNSDGSRTSNGAPAAAGSGASSRGGAMTPMMPPQVGRGVSGSGAGRSGMVSGGRRRRRSDPDDPWAPPPGVPAVLEPAPEPEFHDPGPGVIGIDR